MREKKLEERQIASSRLLVFRLERLSADSYWAHQASGLRGSLLRYLQRIDTPNRVAFLESEAQAADWQRFDELIERGFEVLSLAARAMRRPTPRSLRK